MNDQLNTCDICGQQHDDLTTVANGDRVCPDCLQDYVQCDNCGEWFPDDELTTVRGGGLVCEDCLDFYDYCEHCGEYVPEQDAVVVQGRYGPETWCESCAADDALCCDDCGEWFTSDQISLDDGETHICGGCSENWIVCQDCEAVVNIDNAQCIRDAWYCDSCAEDHHSAVHDYSYKPTPIFGHCLGDGDDALTFGVELEVDNGDDVDATAQLVEDLGGGRVYIKHDGSLDDGFEIVSHPGTLAHHMQEMPWSDLCRACLDDGFRSHDAGTCGLHIHVGRRQLGQDGLERGQTAAKLTILAARLWPQLVTFSRRTDGQLERWASRPRLDLVGTTAEELLIAARDTKYDGRYQAVNLTNTTTIEFRIFRGTLKRDTIVASLQLVDDLCKYAMAHDVEDCRAASFKDVVAVHPWKELTAYCQDRGLLPAPAPAPDPLPGQSILAGLCPSLA